MGSLYCLSPEQIQQSRRIDQRSGFWSLAVILFRAVTGKLPFTGDEAGFVIR
jgi:serine/threonine-protein kinase